MPQLLAARDVQLDAEEAATTAEQAAAEPAERPSCAICLEPYSVAGSIVPRMLRCGHDFCEGCINRMLAPEPVARKRKKRLQCPGCRQEHAIRSGWASELPTAYALQGA